MTLLTVAQFCERASISRATVYREIKAGRLPVKRFGASGRVRIPDTALEAAVEPPPSSPEKKPVVVVTSGRLAAYRARRSVARS